MKREKIAVVLYNLGGPANRDEVSFFLFNLFYDKNIINLPNPFRFFLAKLIAKIRRKKAIKNYDKIGGKSPLLENTLNQANSLQKKLSSKKYRVFISMNFCHPLPEQTLKEVIDYEPNKIILLPLYPQFSTTTTGSFLTKWNNAIEKFGVNCNQQVICCYYDDEGFIRSYSNILQESYNNVLKNGKPYVIFVAHGLPERIISAGDPYKWQVEKTVKGIVEAANIKDLDYILSYQSRVGFFSWIKPYADEVIKKVSSQKNILVIPISFVSEHVETLVELDLEYKELAIRNGAKAYYRAKTLGENDFFIMALKNLIVKSDVASKRQCCPSEYCKCYQFLNK